MIAEQVLQRYVREVAGQLPVKMRSDVTLELTSLLREDLQARAEAAGRVPDEALAIEVLESYGHPREVANRYHPRWAVIDPADTRGFFMSVIVGFAVLVAFTVPSALLTPEKAIDHGEILVTWIGLVTLYFGIKSAVQRKWPKVQRWNPRKDPDRVNRLAMATLILVTAITIALMAEPQRIFAWLTGGRQFASTLDYDPDFRAYRLPWLFAVYIAQAVMVGILAVRGRWNPMLRRFGAACSIGFVAVFAWFRADGPVMADPATDATIKAFMAMIALLLLIDLGVRSYSHAGHGDPAKLRDAVSQ